MSDEDLKKYKDNYEITVYTPHIPVLFSSRTVRVARVLT
jgi:hypothetical protein